MSSYALNFNHEAGYAHLLVSGQDTSEDRKSRMLALFGHEEWNTGYSVIIEFEHQQTNLTSADAFEATNLLSLLKDQVDVANVVIVNQHDNTAHVGHTLAAAHEMKDLPTVHRVADLSSAIKLVS